MNKQERNEYQQALKTYHNQCAMCGRNIVELHHIIYRGNGLTVKENLIPLCKAHHDLVHSNQKHYTEHLLDMNRLHYGDIDRNDLKKKSKYAEFEFSK